MARWSRQLRWLGVDQPQRSSAPEESAPRPLWRRAGGAFWRIVGLFLVVSVFFVTLYRDMPPPATPLMLLRLAEGDGIDRSWAGLDAISPFLLQAVIAGEDQKFCLHRGFDWDAIDTAWQRYRSGRGRLLGASTISMQTAKNVFLWPGRDWLRKALEAYFTALIELAWGKHRIIEVYLNVVEWGPGVYGAEAAAEYYFHKPASRLSPYEAVRLAAVLPDPLDRSVSRPGPATASRAGSILRQIPALPVGRPLPCGQPL
jgi:monofunctional biosynthetic peptidoglycan transglycosylase